MGSDIFNKAQIRLIFKAIGFCGSLFTFSANRVGLTDEDLDNLAISLEKNQSLQKLELERNLITHLTLKPLSRVVRFNKKIKHLSLEGNVLTDSANDCNFKDFCEALAENDTLLFLNLSETQIGDSSGEQILKMLDVNRTLIMINLQQNDIGFKCLRQIQDKLFKNRKLFEEERIFEFKERDFLRNEEKIVNEVKNIRIIGENMVRDIIEEVGNKHQFQEDLYFKGIELESATDTKAETLLNREFVNRIIKKKYRPKGE